MAAVDGSVRRGRPYARATRKGRFWWEVIVYRGPGSEWVGTWSCFGERHARSKARRAVAQTIRNDRWAQAFTVEAK